MSLSDCVFENIVSVADSPSQKLNCIPSLRWKKKTKLTHHDLVGPKTTRIDFLDEINDNIII